MNILITGAEGFVGRHLAAAAAARGHTILETSRAGSVGHRLDLPDAAAARALVADFAPDGIIHLAGVTSVGASARDPGAALRTNVDGTRDLIRALASAPRPCRFLHVSSSAVYGRVPPSRQPIGETEPPCPADHYGWSKLLAECQIALNDEVFAKGHEWIIARPFNHTGPGQSPEFALSDFARQVARIERGEQEPVLHTGNLEVRRDFLDVRDVVHAYLDLMEQDGHRGIYNVSAGEARRLGDLVLELARHARVPFEIAVDATRRRAIDVDVMAGDSSHLRRRSGWQPAIPLETTLGHLLDYWRLSLAGGSVDS